MDEKISVSLPALFALAVLFIWGEPALFPLVLLAAAAHECGHLVGIRLCRRQLVHLRVLVCGAEIVYTQGSYKDDLLIALAGPVASLTLAFAAAAAGRACGAAVFYQLAGISLVLGMFNFLPALPLDGGRILFSILATRSGPDAACRVLYATGVGTAGLLGSLGLYSFWNTGSNFSLICAGLLLIFFVVKSSKMV